MTRNSGLLARVKRRRDQKPSREDVVADLHFAAIAWLVVLCLLPLLVLAIVGWVQYTNTNGIFFPAPGYPAMTTLSAGMIVPALALAVAWVVSVPLPLLKRNDVSRADMVGLAFFGAIATVVSATLDVDSPAWPKEVARVAVWIFVALMVLGFLRIALGWLRLVPREWRSSSAHTKKPRS